ncbi:MAG TPA: heavy metal-binding domain-containing protein [Bacteroidia bacterium]|nr:heavy metal-binding domain-containing protein [Bacteroidia bacterium]
MKKLILLLAIPVLFVACKGNENKSNEATADSASVAATADTTQAAAAAQYTCPMHPDVISDKPGQCPQCGMDLQVKS